MATASACLFFIFAVAGVFARGAPAPYPLDKDKKTAPDTEEPSKKKDASGPLIVFADIEEGWKKGDVDKILQHFGKGKVSISIEGGAARWVV